MKAKVINPYGTEISLIDYGKATEFRVLNDHFTSCEIDDSKEQMDNVNTKDEIQIF